MSAESGGSGSDPTSRHDGDTVGDVLPRPGRSPFLVAFVGLVFIAFGFDVGLTGPVALVVTGVLGVSIGSGFLDSRALRYRAAGSAIVGAGLLFVSLSTLSLPVPPLSGAENVWATILVLLAVGVGFGGLGFAVLVDRGGVTALREALRDSAIVAMIATPILLFGFGGYLTEMLVGCWVLVDRVTVTPAVALLSLHVLALCTLVGAMIARPGVANVSPRPIPIPAPMAVVDRVRSLPNGWYVLLGGYVAIWFLPGVLGLIDSTLSSLGAIGTAVALGLQSGLLHGFLLSLIAVSVCVGFGSVLFVPITQWLQPRPIRTLSTAVGGLVVPLVVFVWGTVGPSIGTPVLGSLALVPLVLAALGMSLLVWLVARFEPSRSHLLGSAAAALLVATIGLAVSGLSSIGVLIGVATAVIAWDVGTTAFSIHRAVGSGVDGREPIAAHATAVVAAAIVGVVLGGAAMTGAAVADRVGRPREAELLISFLLTAVLVVAASAVRPSVTSVRSHLGAWKRWLSSNSKWVAAGGVIVVLGLAGLVDARVIVLLVLLVSVAISVIIDGPTDDRPESLRRRF